MNFLAPLGLLFGLFLPAVVILYLLKLKRINLPISSTLLWRRSLEDLKANTPFQKLKRNLLLFLQLLIMALLTFVIARPVLNLGGLEGQSFIVLIDRSASMAATDVNTNRLEEAKDKAIDLVNDMSMGDRMMVVSYDSKARVLSTFEQDKAVLRSVIRAIETSDAPTQITDALNIARSAAELQPNPEIIIFSDGQFIVPPDFPLGSNAVRFIPIGQSDDNAGIIDLVVRRDFSLSQNYQVLAGIKNTGKQEKNIYVELWGEGDIHGEIESGTDTVTTTAAGGGKNPSNEVKRELMDAREITLKSGENQTIIFKDPGTFPEKIEVILDSDDKLDSDNHAWALIPKDEIINVLLVSSGNYFLERVLNLDVRSSIGTVSPVNYTGPENYDLVVFDTFAPETLVPGQLPVHQFHSPPAGLDAGVRN